MSPGTAPGEWRPTPPDYTVAWGREWGDVTPFAIASPAAFLPPPPPALNSPEYAAALNQVESLGTANSTTRTPDSTAGLAAGDAVGNAVFHQVMGPSSGR